VPFLLSSFKKGVIKPVVSNHFKLEQAKEGLKMLRWKNYRKRYNKSLKETKGAKYNNNGKRIKDNKSCNRGSH
jgi:hypothetical protein